MTQGYYSQEDIEAASLSTEPVNRAEVTKMIHHLYNALGSNPPHILWAASPYQALAMVLSTRDSYPLNGLRRLLLQAQPDMWATNWGMRAPGTRSRTRTPNFGRLVEAMITDLCQKIPEASARTWTRANASGNTWSLFDSPLPVITGPQAQGDLLVIPWPKPQNHDQSAIRSLGLMKLNGITEPVVVLTGDNGHDHTLSPAPGVSWYQYEGEGRQTLGVLKVDEGAVGVLGHIEHGDSYIGPGVYVIRRQREFSAEAVRLVAD